MWVELRRGWGRARRGEEGECILSGGIAGSVRAVLNHDLLGTSLAVQWLGLRALTAKGLGSIPGQETKIPQPATPHPQIKSLLLGFSTYSASASASTLPSKALCI